jgi:hypothetical protein
LYKDCFLRILLSVRRKRSRREPHLRFTARLNRRQQPGRYKRG